MVNIQLLDGALARIDANPTSWDQQEWRCGTYKCLAGHAADQAGAVWARQYNPRGGYPQLIPQLAGGVLDPGEDMLYDPDTARVVQQEFMAEAETWTASSRYLDAGVVHVADWAAHHLGVTHQQAHVLFRGLNTRQQLQAMRDALAADPDADLKDVLCRFVTRTDGEG
jgi:hypothetical protein